LADAGASSRRSASAAGDLLQLALKRSGAPEQAAVDLFELVRRGEEHETARDTNGNSDCSVLELDCETLGRHFSFSNEADACDPRRRFGASAVCQEAPRGSREALLIGEGPGHAPAANAAAQGVRLVPCCCPDEFPTEGTDQP
jgi:hypothetical protein